MKQADKISNFFNIKTIYKYPFLLIFVFLGIYAINAGFATIFYWKYAFSYYDRDIFFAGIFMFIAHNIIVFYIFLAFYNFVIFRFYLRKTKLYLLYITMITIIFGFAIYFYINSEINFQRLNTAIGIYVGLSCSLGLFFIWLNILTLKYKIYNFFPFLYAILMFFILLLPFFISFINLGFKITIFFAYFILIPIYWIYKIYKIRNEFLKRYLS